MMSLLVCLGVFLHSALANDAVAPRYVTDGPRLVEVGQSTTRARQRQELSNLLTLLQFALDKGEVKRLQLGRSPGQVINLWPWFDARGRLSRIPRGVLGGLGYFAASAKPGDEIDLLAVSGDELRPVGIRWSALHTIEVEVGEPWSGKVQPVSDLETFFQRWGLELETDGSADWTPDELGLLDHALGFLSNEELARIKGLPFRRSNAEIRLPQRGRALASYRFDIVQGYRFEFYSLRLHPEQSGFVGEVSNPSPGQVLTILHELGHAIADRRRREFTQPLLGPIARLNASVTVSKRASKALDIDPDDATELAAQKRAQSAYDTALAELNSHGVDLDEYQMLLDWMMSTRGVEDHAASLLQGRAPITAYAGTSSAEAFAEMFAYSKADPAAMRRVYPEVAEWILSGAYLKLVDQEPLPSDAP